MPRIYSWRLSDKTYAYLVNPEKINEPCLRKRITNSNDLRLMATTINTWTESEYLSRFNAMNEKIIESYGVAIPWSSSFFNDTNTTVTTIIDNDFNKDDFKQELLDDLLINIEEAVGRVNLGNDTIINELRTNVVETNLNTLRESKAYVDEKKNLLLEEINNSKNLFDTKFSELQASMGDFYVEVENKTGNITEIENEVTSHRKHFEDITKRIDIVQGNVENNVKDVVAEKFKDINVTLDGKIFEEVNTIIGSINFSGQIDTALSSFEDKFGRRIGDVESSIDDFRNNLTGFSGTVISMGSQIKLFDDQIKNFQIKVNNVESANTEISDLRTQITTLREQVNTTNSSVSSLSGQVSSVKTDIESINTDINTIGSDFNNLSTTLTKFNSGITFNPQIRQPYGTSMSPHVSGYNYRTSTGHEIIVDDEIIELKSDKARIYIDDTGIHLEGDVFINGVKIK